MLGKLIKHEFKATARRMVPMLLILLGMTFIARFVLPVLGASDYKLVSFFYYIGLILYVLCFIAVGIVALLMLIERFRTHVLGNEGYSTMTMPVTAHQILWSKIIVFFVWFVVIGTAVTVSILFVEKVDSYQIRETIQQIVEYVTETENVALIHYILYFLESVALTFVTFTGTLLGIFASLMIGQQSAKAKMFVAVLVFIGFNVLFSFAGVFGTLAAEEIPVSFWDRLTTIVVAGKLHPGILALIVISAIPAVIYYFITAAGMKKHLNLE